MALLAEIEETFQGARQTLVLCEAFRLWQKSQPQALADFENLEDLIALCRRPDAAAYGRKSDVLAALCLEARSAEGSSQLAGLLICWLLLPGLWELSNTLSPISCLSLDEMDGELIAGLWNVAATISPGSRKVAGRLIRGAHNKAVRRIVREWAYSRHFEPTDEIAPVARNSSEITESEVIAEAKCNGVLTDYEARLIEASRLQDVSLQDLANLDGVSCSGLRLKRWRAEARLAAWLADGDVPSRRIVSARETNHADVSPCVSAGLADPSISDGNGRNTTTKGGIAVGLGTCKPVQPTTLARKKT